MRRLLLVLSLVIWAMPAQAQLTDPLYDAEVSRFFRESLSSLDDATRCQLIQRSVVWARQGTIQRESQRRFLREWYEAQTGRDLDTATARVRHHFTHFVNECSYGDAFTP